MKKLHEVFNDEFIRKELRSICNDLKSTGVPEQVRIDFDEEDLINMVKELIFKALSYEKGV